MLYSFFGRVRRSLSRKDCQSCFDSPASAYDGFPRGSRVKGKYKNQWRSYSRSIDDDDESDVEGGSEFSEDDRHGTLDGGDDNSEDEQLDETPLLPIFEASRLDTLPVYSITHAIRLLVISKCETTLTWDQLRSPQVSQFLVKPIQRSVLDDQFSKATVYALIANCLQFNKEADLNPAIVGMSRTRAMVCELVAIRVLKEYSTRELIDVLSYDFYPLQGMAEASCALQAAKRPQAARTSTLEVAIRAAAKQFLAHPTVVQQLEAIWAGTIVFHHAADAAHRRPRPALKSRQYGTMRSGTTSGLLSQGGRQSTRLDDATAHLATRRSVTLYDPREASIFKLSRLRVPRYRHFLSTCSLAIFLGLFLAVLTERSINISTLEIVFWIWSAGFMLDEVVGFNEQGFSLYIMSIWNAFDLGILLLLICFYALRLYGILLLGKHKESISYLAFDVLAANAILLFPRLFSILDHYRYFSQLLIAFRMMAQDLVAVFILVAISCSGFFVAFTLSFGNASQNAGETAYALFQMLMGFTPTAWQMWDDFSLLGRTILVIFLIITHFLVVTILVTVLTNSFTAIVQNAHDEHQFVFAVNTISMVKSDALFSYIAPSNFLGWLLTPLRYAVPFRQFVWLNRTVIKLTHLPVLFSIFAYERLVLGMSVYEEPSESEDRGRKVHRARSFDPVGSGMMIFSPREPRLREPSAATFYKDRALAEVFRRPLPDTVRKSEKERKKRAAVDTWIQNMGPGDETTPPDEQDLDMVDHLDRPGFRGWRVTPRRYTSAMSYATRSMAASETEDVHAEDIGHNRLSRGDIVNKRLVLDDLPEQSDNYGDDELVSNDDATDQTTANDQDSIADPHARDSMAQDSSPPRARLMTRSMTSPNFTSRRPATMLRHSSISFAESTPQRTTPLASRRTPGGRPSTSRRIPQHRRDISIQTVLFNPSEDGQKEIATDDDSNNSEEAGLDDSEASEVSSPLLRKGSRGSNLEARASRPSERQGLSIPVMDSRSGDLPTPKANLGKARANNAISTVSGSPPSSSIVNTGRGPAVAFRGSYPHKQPSMRFDLASDLGDNKAAAVGGLPASFATHIDFATRLRRMRSEERHDDDRRMNKLMLARMGVLEQGFREVLKEVKEMRGTEKAGGSKNAGKKNPTRSSTMGSRPSPLKMSPSNRGSNAGGKTVASDTEDRGEDTAASSRLIWGDESPAIAKGSSV